MSDCARPCFQREAHGDARFSVATQCSAPHCRAMQGIAKQSNADRSLATGSFPGRFGPKAAPRTARQGNARQCNSKQRGLPTGNSGFSGPLWSERNSMRCTAYQCSARHCTSKQRGSPTGNSGFSGPLWSECTARKRTARRRKSAHCSAVHCTARNGNSKQRGSELGNRLFSGLFWHECSAKHRSAWKGIALHGKAIQSNAVCTFIECAYRAVLPIRQGRLGRFINGLTTEKTTWP